MLSGIDYQEVDDRVHEGDPELRILYDIYRYAKVNPKFDTDFVDSIEEFLELNGYVTEGQYNALVKVFNSFHMRNKIEQKYEYADVEE